MIITADIRKYPEICQKKHVYYPSLELAGLKPAASLWSGINQLNCKPLGTRPLETIEKCCSLLS